MRISYGKLLILEVIAAFVLVTGVLSLSSCSDEPRAPNAPQTATTPEAVDTTWITCVDAAHDTVVYVAEGHEFNPSTNNLFCFVLHYAQKKMNVWNQNCTWEEPK